MIENFERYKPESVIQSLSGSVFSTNKKHPEKAIFRDIITFDIETTSIDKERSVMYIWQICVNGRCFYGRLWSEFENFISLLNSYGARYYIWVHNLSFEFAFIQSLFDFSEHCKVHESHSVREAEYKNIIFRCTYFMTNLSLEKVAEQYKLDFEKLDGNAYNYDLKRYSFTELTDFELKYCQHDVLILWAYIKTFDKPFSKIPSTATGFTRALYKDNIKKYGDTAKIATIAREDVCSNPEDFELLQNAFAGGYTHANSRYIGHTLENVRSRDKTSFYPSIMARFKFPRKLTRLNSEDIEKHFTELYNAKDSNGEPEYFLIIRVGFTNLRARGHITTISEHKCLELSGSYYEDEKRKAYKEELARCDEKRRKEIEREIQKPDIDNGRLFSCKHVLIDITSLDLETIDLFYEYDEKVIIKGLWSKLRYLPVSLLMTMLELYAQKTELKNVEGKEDLYMALKALLNSLFGVCVTSPLREKWVYKEYEFYTEDKPPIEEQEEELKKYARNHGLLYQWGVYITSVSRNEILHHNHALGDVRVIYNDTDSIKYFYDDFTEKYFEDFDNNVVKPQLRRCYEYLKDNIPALDWKYFEPLDIENNKHLLGIIEVEGTYKYFKTLGCKRYIHTDINKKGEEILKCTVAGCPKKAMKAALETRGKTWKEIFRVFRYDLEVRDCKKIHYFTEPKEPEEMTDYRGVKGVVKCEYGISLLPCSFKMSQAATFYTFLSVTLPSVRQTVFEYYKNT